MFEKLSQYHVSYFTKRHQLSPLGKKIEQLGKRAVNEAITLHKATGNPIYYKEEGKLIKELVDGTRYLVRASQNGIETIKQL